MKLKDYLKEQILLESNNDIEIKKIIKILEKKTDFFEAPASTKYHLAFEGGLAIHSIGVIKQIKKNIINKNYDIPMNSAIKCALIHDLCKTNYYKLQPDGTYKANWDIKGHGDRSVDLCKKYGIELNNLEKAMVEFHMGPFAPMGTLNYVEKMLDINEAKERLSKIKDYQDKYSNEVKKYPQILAIYSADHYSSVKENTITKETVKKDFENWKKENLTK